MLTTDDLAARTERAVAAAAAVGRDLGLEVTEPRVLYDLFSVVVHLAPAPVVVRVPTVLPRHLVADSRIQLAQQRREIDVAAWLSAGGHPVVPPSPLLGREPVYRDGFSMTFWQFVEQITPDGLEMADRARATADLHAVLGDYKGQLPFMMPLDEFIPDSLTQLERRPELLDADSLARARREWEILGHLTSGPDIFAAAFPSSRIQPIHGDAPFHNLIPTAQGVLWSDFEHITLGPVEWDIALAGPEMAAAYDDVAADRGLPTLDRRLLRVMDAARALQVVACLALVDELPQLADGLKPSVDHWRSMPEAGGLTAADLR